MINGFKPLGKDMHLLKRIFPEIYKGSKMEQQDIIEEQIRGAVARGWCHPKNSSKEMDVDLAEAIAQEIIKLFKNENNE